MATAATAETTAAGLRPDWTAANTYAATMSTIANPKPDAATLRGSHRRRALTAGSIAPPAYAQPPSAHRPSPLAGEGMGVGT